MNGRIVIRPQAQREIDDHAEYIAFDRPSAAARFLAAVAGTLRSLGSMPLSGKACRFRSVRLRGLRWFPVRRFRKYLVFYRRIEDGIEVLHVFHGAQNIRARLRTEGEQDVE